MALRLFEIGEAFEALEQTLLENGGEWSEEIEAAFLALGQIEGDKVDAYGFLIKGIESRREAYKKAADELNAKASASTNAVKRLKDRLGDYMRFRKVRELKGSIWAAAIQKNGGKAPLILGSENPDDFPAICRKVETSIDGEKVRELMAAGLWDNPSLAHLGEIGEHVRVR